MKSMKVQVGSSMKSMKSRDQKSIETKWRYQDNSLQQKAPESSTSSSTITANNRGGIRMPSELLQHTVTGGEQTWARTSDQQT